MVTARIDLPLEQIAEIAGRYKAQRLALFGSVIRDDFTPESDVDILVEFPPGVVHGFGFWEMEAELSDLIGRAVDLKTPASLSKYFRDEVLAETEDIYVAPLPDGRTA